MRGRTHSDLQAHSVLFAAELAEFRTLLPPVLREEMSSFSAMRRKENADKKQAKAVGKLADLDEDSALELAITQELCEEETPPKKRARGKKNT